MQLRATAFKSLVLALAVSATACGDEPADGDSGGAAGSSGTAGSAGTAGVGGTAGAAGSRAAAGSSGTAGAAGSSSTGGTGGGLPELCGGLTVSGIVEFEIGDETLRVGTMNTAFFNEARRLFESGEQRVPLFNTLIDGSACDAQWSWHPDPVDMEFADITIEFCDGLPSYIEQNKTDWFQSVGSYCPWSARVTDFVIVDPP